MNAADIIIALSIRGHTVATAESLTGGLLCGILTSVPGASAVVRGGVVAYAVDIKANVLNVDAELLARHGAVDPVVAVHMA
ncbi:MAG: nicotinamide-nucleotide amidohydrolase family protein, partial [Candidatus Nanopelagicales bacterium]|nr:nicotinamide-nucleotide amidohydrolase family protein [Candidatus Nanopelagicales bacterium]